MRAPAPIRWWSRFWFAPQESSVLALWRTALGFTCFWWMISFTWDLQNFFSETGLRPDPFYDDWRIGFFQWFESDTAIYSMYATVLVASLLVMVGKWVWVTAPLMMYGVLSFQLDNLSVLNAGDSLMRIWPAYLTLFVLLTPSRLVGVPLWGRRQPDGRRIYPQAPRWLLRIVQIQITVIYPAAAIAKLAGDAWRNGTASLYAMKVTDFQRFPVPDFIENSKPLGAIFTWYSLGLELTLPVLLWFPRTRRPAIAMGVLLHVGFGYTMRLGFFAWVMVIGYIAFLTPSEARRIIGWLSRLDPRRHTIDDPPGDAGASDAIPDDPIGHPTELTPVEEVLSKG